MRTKLTAENIKILSELSAEDFNRVIENCTNEKHLKSVNWIFKSIGLQSFAHCVHSDFECMYAGFIDPTQQRKTKFYKALDNYRKEMVQSFGPLKLFIFIWMVIRSRRMEKVTIQLFTHLHSYEETKDFAFELFIALKRNNAYYKTQSRFGLTNYTVEGIESIIDSEKHLNPKAPVIINNIYIDESSSTNIVNNYTEEITNVTIVKNTHIEDNSSVTINNNHTDEITNIYVNQDLSTHTTINNNEFKLNIFEFKESSQPNNTTFQFAVFPYIHRHTSKLDKLGQFLENCRFIKYKNPFINLFVSSNKVSEEVIWMRELTELCFLMKALMIFEIISKNEQFTWAKKTSQNFVSISPTKSRENIKSRSLTTISSDMGLTWLTMDDIEDWVNSYNSEPISMIYQELNKLYR